MIETESLTVSPLEREVTAQIVTEEAKALGAISVPVGAVVTARMESAAFAQTLSAPRVAYEVIRQFRTRRAEFHEDLADIQIEITGPPSVQAQWTALRELLGPPSWQPSPYAASVLAAFDMARRQLGRPLPAHRLWLRQLEPGTPPGRTSRSADEFDVTIARGLPPQMLRETVWYEAKHLRDLLERPWLPIAELESRAEEFVAACRRQVG